MFAAHIRVCLFGAGMACTSFADWRTDIGADDLELFLGTSPADGAGVVVGQIEASTSGESNYLPQTPPAGETTSFVATGEFSGKTIFLDSGAGTVNAHASGVGRLFFGNTGSLAPGVSEVHNQSAAGFIFLFLGSPYVNPDDPIPELEVPRVVESASGRIQSHAYIARAADLDPTKTSDFMARMDFMADSSGVLAVVGLANGSTSAVPPLWNSAYNVLSVGRTDGGHSTGLTDSGFDGAGRVKPEIVVPLSTTSSGTGAVASVGTFLASSAANLGLSNDAQRPEVLKAIIMAGASKAPFADWDNSSAPLDPHFGAGEVDLVASHRILSGTQHSAGSEATPTVVPRRGWSFDSVNDSAPDVFAFTVPMNGLGAECSIVLTWHRTVNETVSGRPSNREYNYSPAPLANLSLSLIGPNGFELSSDSTVDNVEHIYVPLLTAGTYEIRVGSASSEVASYALAWRAEQKLQPSLDADETAAGNHLEMDGLESNWTFWIERSADYETWSTAGTFSAPAGLFEWSDPSPPEGSGFYRLKWFAP